MSQKIPITNGKLLTLTTSEDDLKMFLFEIMMRPKMNEFYKRNSIIINSLHESHQRLINKFFEKNDDGSLKYSENLEGYKDSDGNLVAGIPPSPIYKSGMTQEMFATEQKEWSEKQKTMDI